MTLDFVVDSPLVRRAPVPAAEVRLVCVPYAGAGASVFHSWPGLMQPTAEVLAVQLPGREDRQFEPPPDDIERLVARLAANLKPYATRPLALYGHCSGALLAYEVAVMLQDRYGIVPQHLFVAAYPAPHLPVPSPRLSHLTDDELREELHRLGAAPRHLLDNDDLMALLLPGVRADFALWEGYRPRDVRPLQCPVTCIGGATDERVDEGGLKAWAEHTTAGCDVRIVEGGHYFMNGNAAAVTALVTDALARAKTWKADA